MSIGSKPNGPGPNKSGSTGVTGPSTKMNLCAAAGAAKVAGGAKACGSTGKQGAQPNKSGSRGGG